MPFTVIINLLQNKIIYTFFKGYFYIVLDDTLPPVVSQNLETFVCVCFFRFHLRSSLKMILCMNIVIFVAFLYNYSIQSGFSRTHTKRLMELLSRALKKLKFHIKIVFNTEIYLTRTNMSNLMIN